MASSTSGIGQTYATTQLSVVRNKKRTVAPRTGGGNTATGTAGNPEGGPTSNGNPNTLTGPSIRPKMPQFNRSVVSDPMKLRLTNESTVETETGRNNWLWILGLGLLLYAGRKYGS